MLYEVGDPGSYVLPDVICDFTGVTFKMTDNGRVLATGAKGKPATDSYKVSATYLDGFKATCVAIIGGGRAAAKGKAVADAIMTRSKAIFNHMKMGDFDNSYICALGSEDSFGANARSHETHPRESALWMAVQHKDKKALDIWAREIASSGTGMAPGKSLTLPAVPAWVEEPSNVNMNFYSRPLPNGWGSTKAISMLEAVFVSVPKTKPTCYY